MLLGVPTRGPDLGDYGAAPRRKKKVLKLPPMFITGKAPKDYDPDAPMDLPAEAKKLREAPTPYYKNPLFWLGVVGAAGISWWLWQSSRKGRRRPFVEAHA